MKRREQVSLDPLRVLKVATTFPRWADDNEPKFVFDLAKHLAKKVSLWVLVPHAPGAELREEIENMKIIRFPYFFPAKLQVLCYGGGILPNLKSSWLSRFQLPFFLSAQLFFIWRTVRRCKIDIIHCHWLIPQGFFVALVGAFHKIPYILTAHGADVFAFKGNAFVGWLRKFVLKHAELCSVNSLATLKALEAISPGSRFQYLPNGVDKELFHEKRRDDRLKKELGMNGIFLLGVGRFAEKKGFKYLIEAMPKILEKQPEAKLALVGFGPEEAALKQQVEALGLSDAVIFPGPKSGTELAKYFATADIFIGPSIVEPGGDTEGQGIVFMEALAAKSAVVASNVGGIPDMVKDGVTGLLVPEKDSRAIAEKVLSLCENPQRRAELAQNGRHLMEQKFSWEVTADLFLEAYREIDSRKK